MVWTVSVNSQFSGLGIIHFLSLSLIFPLPTFQSLHCMLAPEGLWGMDHVGNLNQQMIILYDPFKT